ncbi:DUF1810 domain-containing protein [Horticoccus luteus]|uniref:DUF1810 domain-containing protein n=1 Tax=Horticoccus luteus TaxID=2862869 RepID=A0A8F9TU74_9BACT|nr:DUF1810 family protein [Horticoccus luteus]QYM77657.1 DUF1810 domain-containing protein [Horticoccus luteus]
MALERFHEAQNQRGQGFSAALAELQTGEKTSHWIWYVFPQLAGLGRSSTAQFYAVRDGAEACAYLADTTLRGRLLRVTEVVAAQLAGGVPLVRLMGGRTDALKLVSSLTLFEWAARAMKPVGTSEAAELQTLRERCGDVLGAATDAGFPRCDDTLNALARSL